MTRSRTYNRSSKLIGNHLLQLRNRTPWQVSNGGWQRREPSGLNRQTIIRPFPRPTCTFHPHPMSFINSILRSNYPPILLLSGQFDPPLPAPLNPNIRPLFPMPLLHNYFQSPISRLLSLSSQSPPCSSHYLKSHLTPYYQRRRYPTSRAQKSSVDRRRRTPVRTTLISSPIFVLLQNQAYMLHHPHLALLVDIGRLDSLTRRKILHSLLCLSNKSPEMLKYLTLAVERRRMSLTSSILTPSTRELDRRSSVRVATVFPENTGRIQILHPVMSQLHPPTLSLKGKIFFCGAIVGKT